MMIQISDNYSEFWARKSKAYCERDFMSSLVNNTVAVHQHAATALRLLALVGGQQKLDANWISEESFFHFRRSDPSPHFGMLRCSSLLAAEDAAAAAANVAAAASDVRHETKSYPWVKGELKLEEEIPLSQVRIAGLTEKERRLARTQWIQDGGKSTSTRSLDCIRWDSILTRTAIVITFLMPPFIIKMSGFFLHEKPVQSELSLK